MPYEDGDDERLEDLLSNDEEKGDERRQEGCGRIDEDVEPRAVRCRCRSGATIGATLMKEATMGLQQGNTLLAVTS